MDKSNIGYIPSYTIESDIFAIELAHMKKILIT